MKKRSALKKGNVYYSGPSGSRRFLVSEVCFKGPNPGVAVQWLTTGGSVANGQFFLFSNEAEFWRFHRFRNAVDAEGSE
jgi:hypothetical protein